MLPYTLFIYSHIVPKLDKLSDRLLTFKNWSLAFDSDELANDGFIYIGANTVACVFCNLHLFNLQLEDQNQINNIHLKYSPCCPHALLFSKQDHCGSEPMWKLHCDSERLNNNSDGSV